MTGEGRRPAVWGISEGAGVTHQALRDAIVAFSSLLRANGVSEGDVVAISCAGRLNQAIYLLCGLHHRVTIAPLNPEYHVAELRRILTHCDARLVITDQPERIGACGCRVAIADLRGLLASHRSASALPPLASGLLIYTSGTTGAPKAVLLSPENITANVAVAVDALGYDPNWTTASILPLFHTFTLISDLLPMVRLGGTCVVCPTFTAQHAAVTQRAMAEHRVRSYSGVPVIFQAMTALRGDDAPSWEVAFAVAGAAPLSERVRLAYDRRAGHPVIPCYGLSESTCFTAISPLRRIKPRSVGQPRGIDVRIVEPNDGRPVAPGGIGEIAIRGPSVMANGYFNDPLDRARRTPEGYFLTGDMGCFDEEQYLYVTGRRKNMVIRGGAKIYLEDLDAVIGDLPAVTECVSVVRIEPDRPDEVWTCIALQDGGTLAIADVMAHVGAHLSSQHCPDRVRFVERIPRTVTGKPLMHALLHLVAAP